MQKKKADIKIIDWMNFGSFPGFFMFTMGFNYDQIHNRLSKMKDAKEWLVAFESAEDLFRSKAWGSASQRTVVNTRTNDEKKFHFLHIRSNFDFSDFDMIALAHEAVHLCSFYLSDLMDPIKENEAFAYTHSHVMRQILQCIRKK